MRALVAKVGRFPLLLLAIATLAAQAAAAGSEPVFAYDRTADFALEEVRSEIRGDAIVRDITFFSAPGETFGRIAAYVVTPRSVAPRADILWVHWLGEPHSTNRTEFLEEAVALAKRGIVSLLIDTMWAKPQWYRDRVLDRDFEDGVAQVASLRRSLDLLQQQTTADKLPLAIVGHDYGGMYAMIAAAQESRVKTCVFIACAPSLNDWAFFIRQPASMDDYLKENAPLDLRTNLGAIKNASILFQFAEHDNYVPLPKAQELFIAASTPKQMIIYGGADHEMTKPATIQEDRVAWLVRELAFP